MKLFEKLQLIRVELQNQNIKKSGKNKFANYMYFELGDILPSINELEAKYKVCDVITYTKEEAKLELMNSENSDEKIVFTSSVPPLENLKGANAIQSLGAQHTYMRRYLYMTAFNIVESDFIDATTQPTNTESQKSNRDNTGNRKSTDRETLKAKTKEKFNKGIKQYAERMNMTIPVVVEMINKQIKNIFQKDDIQNLNNTEALTVVGWLQEQ